MATLSLRSKESPLGIVYRPLIPINFPLRRGIVFPTICPFVEQGPMKTLRVSFQDRAIEASPSETWIAFLRNANLITVDEGTYRLTDLGVDFISQYAPAMHLKPSDRAL
jgi:hypothetical protein